MKNKLNETNGAIKYLTEIVQKINGIKVHKIQEGALIGSDFIPDEANLEILPRDHTSDHLLVLAAHMNIKTITAYKKLDTFLRILVNTIDPSHVSLVPCQECDINAHNFMLHLSIDVLDKVHELWNLMEIMIELYQQVNCIDELLQKISEINNLSYLDKNRAGQLMKKEGEHLYLVKSSPYIN